MQISNSTILITGGAVRVGRAISEMLAGQGARLFCHYNKSEQAALELAEKFSSVTLLQSDISTAAAAQELVDEVIRQSGRIDVLINNSALFFKTPPGTVTSEQWDTLFNVNLKAAFFAAQQAAVAMKKQGQGKIINIGDTSGENPWPSYLPYSITKAGVIAMTRGLAKAFAPQVQVMCINPGPVIMPGDMDNDEKQFALRQTLLNREGSGNDIANAVRFIIEQGDYMTGTCLYMDGGRSVR